MKPLAILLLATAACAAQKAAAQKPAAPKPPRLSFVNDIVPILTKAGCANSNCHGSIRGQNGFKLSLFGYEPEQDYEAITKDADGRRIDRAQPPKSLILLKPTFQIAHGGGQRFPVGSLEYTAILDWLRQGAQFDSVGSPRIVSLRVSPAEIILPAAGAATKLKVVANYSNGYSEDVSAKVQYTPNDETVVEVRSEERRVGKECRL